MGPPKISEDPKILAKSKIQSLQKKSEEKVKKKKRRNSLLDKIRKDAVRGRLLISGGESLQPASKNSPPKPKDENGSNTNQSKMVKVKTEECVSLIRKSSKEKVASTSHLKAQFVGTSELPNIGPRRRSRHHSWPLRKEQDNELGYDDGRHWNRHRHQQKRQEAYLAYKYNKDSSSSGPSDWEYSS